MKLPKSWSEVTISQYQQLLLIDKSLDDFEQTYQMLHIFLGEDANNIKVSEVISYASPLEFIRTPVTGLKTTFDIKERKFAVQIFTQYLTAGQYIDLTELLKKDINNNLHNLMAVLATEERKGYEGYVENGKLFKDHLTMDIVFPVSAFFLKISQSFSRITQGYLIREAKREMGKMNRSLWYERLKRRLITNIGVGM